MRHRRFIGSVLALFALCILTWFPVVQQPMTSWKIWAQWVGFIGFSAYTFSLLLSVKTHWLDRASDGLDKIYRYHHWFGVTTFSALTGHVSILSLRWLTTQPSKSLWFPFPIHPRVNVNLGSYAFWLLVLLILLTLWRGFPYRVWRLTHKLMGVPYVLGVFHVLLSQRAEAKSLVMILACIGVSAWLWDLAIGPMTRRWTLYHVTNIERPTPRHLIISVVPKQGSVSFIPGQYLFTRFVALSREPHPFTPWALEGDRIRMSIKVTGDFTRRLHRELQVGTEVHLSAPFGTFDYQRGKQRQIWVGGGVGIAPFLSWLHAMERGAPPISEVTLFYCIHDEPLAIHCDEIEKLSASLSNMRTITILTGREGHVSGSRIASAVPDLVERTLFLCGPPAMVRDLRRQLLRQGCPPGQIHSEAFAFRKALRNSPSGGKG